MRTDLRNCSDYRDCPARKIIQQRVVRQASYSEDEVRRLLDVSLDSDITIGVAIQIIRETRMRVSELFTLKWDCVDTASRTVSWKGKAGALTRTMSEQLIDLLDMQKGQNANSEHIFTGIDDLNLKCKLMKLCDKAGVPYRGFHSLRLNTSKT